MEQEKFNNGFINPFSKVSNNINNKRLLGSKIFYIFIKELFISEISNKNIFSSKMKSNNFLLKYFDSSLKSRIINNTLEKVFDNSSEILNNFIGTSKKIDLPILNEMIKLHKLKSNENNKLYLFLSLLGLVIVNTNKNINGIENLVLSEMKNNKKIKNISPVLERFSFINKSFKDNIIPLLTIICIYKIPTEKMDLVYEKWNFAKNQFKKNNK